MGWGGGFTISGKLPGFECTTNAFFLTLTLICERRMFTYANTFKKKHLEIHFMCFGIKSCCIFKAFGMISAPRHPPTKFCLFYNFISLYSCDMFSINCALQFKYHPPHLQGREKEGCVSCKGIFILEEVSVVVRTVAQIFQLHTISGSSSQQSAEVRIYRISARAAVRILFFFQ